MPDRRACVDDGVLLPGEMLPPGNPWGHRCHFCGLLLDCGNCDAHVICGEAAKGKSAETFFRQWARLEVSAIEAGHRNHVQEQRYNLMWQRVHAVYQEKPDA